MARAWGQKGASHREIERRLLAANSRQCVPPLEAEEVKGIAANVRHYVRESNFVKAWVLVEKEGHRTRWQKFVAIINHLHNLQPDLPFMLPVVKVAEHLSCNPAEVSHLRKRALAAGIIKVVRDYIPRREATLFIRTQS
jgi:hypothetical protein